MTRPRYILAASLAACATPAMAQPFADPVQIEAEVAAFLGLAPSQAGTVVAPVDRRLRLAQCAMPLALDWPGNRRDSVLVKCPEANGWKLYVRVSGQAAAATAAPAIKRGDSVTVTVRGSGFSVSQTAQALEDGAPGEWVRVRVGKDSELQAQVIRPGAVGMNLQ